MLCVSVQKGKKCYWPVYRKIRFIISSNIGISFKSYISQPLFFFIYYSFQNYLRMQTLIVLSFNNTEKNICIRIYRFTNKNEMMKIFYRCLNMLLMDKRF